jgi:hypothetical protein
MGQAVSTTARERLADLILPYVPPIYGIPKGVECLLQLTIGGTEILREISRQVAAEPFGDQSWSGTRGVPQLIMQISIGSDESGLDQIVDGNLQFIGQLPDDQFLV